MMRPRVRRSKKAGLPPGTMVHVGDRKAEEVSISLLDYDGDSYEMHQLAAIEEAYPFKDTPSVTWLNISGLHEVEILKKLGEHFAIHSLILEDILNTDQRPKVEMTDSSLFVVLKMINYDEAKDEMNMEQVSLILGSNFVITFQEREGDIFEPIRARIRDNKGRIRKSGPDYLAYSLIDIIVDNYFTVLEKVSDTIEYLEDAVLERPEPSLVRSIHEMKSQLIILRKSIWPLREVINSLERDESPLVSKDTTAYMRDIYDHTIQAIDTIETYRDIISGILDVYLSSISNKMNEVMKVLTIIATIFIPLTFIAGIYGMNFKFMPELQWRWAYPLVLLFMALIGVNMIFYFRRKKWL